jgi:hypothetical protein
VDCNLALKPKPSPLADEEHEYVNTASTLSVASGWEDFFTYTEEDCLPKSEVTCSLKKPGCTEDYTGHLTIPDPSSGEIMAV